MVDQTIKGNNSGGTGDPLDLTTAQVKTMLNLTGTNSGDVTLSAVGSSPNANAASLATQALTLQPFSSAFPGVVTASGGGTTNFLRADGTWATPGGGGSSVAPTVQAFTTGSGTYTRPTSPTPLYIKVRIVGGGAGGSGSSTNANSSTAGTNGNNTTFGSSLLTGGGGQAATADNGIGGLGGTASISSPAVGFAFAGGPGSAGILATVAAGGLKLPGGNGGVTPFGGAGFCSANNSGNGDSAVANTGSGGAGASASDVINAAYTGGGGGAGGYVEATITSPSSTYAYAVGNGGSGGSGAVASGGAGGRGYIIVEEFYQ